MVFKITSNPNCCVAWANRNLGKQVTGKTNSGQLDKNIHKHNIIVWTWSSKRLCTCQKHTVTTFAGPWDIKLYISGHLLPNWNQGGLLIQAVDRNWSCQHEFAPEGCWVMCWTGNFSHLTACDSAILCLIELFITQILLVLVVPSLCFPCFLCSDVLLIDIATCVFFQSSFSWIFTEHSLNSF